MYVFDVVVLMSLLPCLPSSFIRDLFFWGGGFKIMGGIKDLLQRKVNKIFISHGRQTLSSHLLKQSLPWFSGWHFSNSTDAICLCGLFMTVWFFSLVFL